MHSLLITIMFYLQNNNDLNEFLIKKCFECLDYFTYQK